MNEKDKLIQIVQTKENLLRDLRLVEALRLPYWCIAAGYVRNHVWDFLHGYERPTPLNDVDILYYDPADLDEQTEKNWEKLLNNKHADYNWSVKNQARMHLRNDERPYASVEDAMKRWPETATAVGIYVSSGQLEAIAPHGLDDLFGLVVRRSPYFHDKSYFNRRVESKGWLETWPKLRLDEEAYHYDN